ncbi:MAG: SDR family oxidoreductase [Nitrospinae bacterium]|nr:SDR family oxidoreductase [Nitrospinota bacterium]
MKVLVTGATGTVGSEVVKQLSAAGITVRAAVHSPEKRERIKGKGVETVRFDYENPQSIREALKGIEKLFLLTPVAANMVEQVKSVTNEAKSAGIRHIVRQSAFGSQLEETLLQRWHFAAEEAIGASGIPYTILRPNFFMQNYLTYPAVDGAYYLPLGTARVSIVDVRDIAAVAVKALHEKGHEGRIYPITGPEAITAAEAVALIAKASGGHFRYVDTPPEEARKAMLAGGMPEWLTDALLELYAWARGGKMAEVRNTVEQVTGRKPHSFARFSRDYVRRFKGAARAA